MSDNIKAKRRARLTPSAAGTRMQASRCRLASDARGLSTLEYALLFVILVVGALFVWGSVGRHLLCHVDSGTRQFVRALGASDQDLNDYCRAPGSGGSGQSGKPSGGAPGAGGPTVSLPNRSADAPTRIALPPEINSAMQTSYQNSFPGGKSQERGGTLVQDKNGNLKVVNEATGTSGTFQPNRSVGADETIVATYHTHPYDQSEGGYKGVSFSGADIAYANRHHEPIYVDAGTKQFMIMPSKATTASATAIKDDWTADFNQELSAGKSMQDASAGASKKVAKKYDMAYYEGTNGSFTRIVP
jgi:hypothetical protein